MQKIFRNNAFLMVLSFLLSQPFLSADSLELAKEKHNTMAEQSTANIEVYSHVVVGRVLDIVTKKPVMSASVEIKDFLSDNKQVAYSDKSGQFTFRLEGGKQYRLTTLNNTGEIEDAKTISTIGAEPIIQVLLFWKTNIEQPVVLKRGTKNEIKSDNTASPIKKETEKVKKEKVVYRIQAGSFSKGGHNSAAARIDKSLTIKSETTNGGMIRLMVGEFSNVSDARKLWHDLQKKGFAKAFVVVYVDGLRTNLTATQAEQKYENR